MRIGQKMSKNIIYHTFDLLNDRVLELAFSTAIFPQSLLVVVYFLYEHYVVL